MSAKKTKGRQKIELSKIENKDDLLVTFSKRRTGLYKKASEMATLCGVEVAIIIESKSQRIHTFGHPTVGKVVDRYMSQDSESAGAIEQILEANRASRIQQLTKEFAQLEMIKHGVRKRGEELKVGEKNVVANGKENFFKTQIEELYLEEVQRKMDKVQEIVKDLKEATGSNMPPVDVNASFSTHCP